VIEKLFKWSLPLLIVINVSLVISGLLDGWTALASGVGIELLIALVAAKQLGVAAMRFRSDRDKGYDFELALEKSLSTFFPERVARLIVLEPAPGSTCGAGSSAAVPSHPTTSPTMRVLPSDRSCW
jgi:hypothetical protein